MKIYPVEAELFHVDGRKDMTKQIVAFGSFVNSPYTGPDRTGPDRTGPDRTGPDRTGPIATFSHETSGHAKENL